MGVCDLRSTFVNRPHNCRWLIAEFEGEFWAIDLFDLYVDFPISDAPHEKMSPGFYTKHKTEDAAMMYATLNYHPRELDARVTGHL